MKQKAILTECFTKQNGEQVFVVRCPDGRVLTTCSSVEEYNQFCVEFFVEPKNETSDECQK